MRIFIAYEGERYVWDVDDGAKVEDIRKDVQTRFMIGGDQAGKPDKKIVVLTYAGADLKDTWVFTDIGITPGTTIRIYEKEEIKPRLFVHCSHNNEVVEVMDEIDIIHSSVADLRGIVSRCSGLPVGVFRLVVDKTKNELFDCHELETYGLQIGDKILLETWDGWTDFLNLSIMGFSSHAMAQISADDSIGRFQMKVAMYIAAHYGHQELALTLLKQGVRADVPVWYHPSRQWCDSDPHIDSHKTPIHECAENGRLNVMKTFVNNNLCAIVAKDGNEKTAFQIALRNKQKPCAGFLLAKQWSRIQYGHSGYTMPLKLYATIKDWCERAKDKTFIIHGQSKSSLKRRPFVATSGTLVGLSVSVDGYGDKKMNGKAAYCPSPTAEQRKKRTFLLLAADKNKNPEQYFKTPREKNSFTGSSKKKTNVRSMSRQKIEARDLDDSMSISKRNEDNNSDSRPPSGADVIKKSGKPSQLLSHAEETNNDINNNDATGENNQKSKAAKKERPSTIIEEAHAQETDDIPFHNTPKSRSRKNFSNAPRRKTLNSIGPTVRSVPMPKDALFKSLAGGSGGGSTSSSKDSTTDFNNDPLKLPKINQKTQMTAGVSQSQPNLTNIGTNNESKGAYLQTGRDDEFSNHERSRSFTESPSKPTKNKQSVSRAMKLAQASQGEGAIPLPVVSLENKTRPYFHHVRSQSDPAISTLSLYEKYRGVQARDNAIKCLSIASNFKDKPWLQQVRLAMTLTAQGVKKVVKNNSGMFKNT